jgi:hypothetical protein
MKCPHCKTSELKPTMIEQDLPAMGCATCHGSLVSLLYYRHWAETQKAPSEQSGNAAASLETTDTTMAITCPKCDRMMAKYKMTGRIANRLDVWELLEALQLSLKMPAIFTDAWQRRIRHELSEESRRSVLTRTIGEEGAVKVEGFRTWLAKNKHKSHILTYLYRS